VPQCWDPVPVESAQLSTLATESSGQQQLFPGSLSDPEPRLEPSSLIPACLFPFLAAPPFPFFDGSTRDHLPITGLPSNSGLQILVLIGTTELPDASPPSWDIWEQLDEGLSLTRMVNWQNLQRRLFGDSLETRGSRIIHDAAKRLWGCGANLWQQTTDSWELWKPWVFPWLGPFFFPIVTLPSSNSFLLCFPEAPGFCPGQYSKTDQFSSIPPTGSLQSLEARRHCWYSPHLRDCDAPVQQEVARGTFSAPFPLYKSKGRTVRANKRKLCWRTPFPL
jgi:hypothetical protein